MISATYGELLTTGIAWGGAWMLPLMAWLHRKIATRHHDGP